MAGASDGDAQRTETRDADLVRKIAAKDREALAILYDRHSPRLLAIAQRYLPNLLDAEDLLHDLFLEVYYQAKSFDSARGSVTSWLVMRLRSRAIDRLRSAAYRKLLSMPDELLEIADPASQWPLEISVSDPLAATLKRALEGLPADTQTILNLVYFKGMSLQEVASQINVPLGTVKSRLHRALRSLRGVLGPVEDDS